MENSTKAIKVLSINAWNIGSTGKIMLQLSSRSREDGLLHYTAHASSRSNSKQSNDNFQYAIGSRISRNLHRMLGYWSGYKGCFSVNATLLFLRRVSKLKPDIVHLHNLHDSYINLPILFKYLKKRGVKVVWTLHDCWAFTGHCPYFTMVNCNKWLTQCLNCPQYRKYPATFFDNSSIMYKLKKKWFTGIKDLTIVTPSKWLSDLVKKSFLNSYCVKVIHNGIDLSVFTQTPSRFREERGIVDKFIILGVAFDWGKRKGLDVLIELAGMLDERFQLILVGTDKNVEALLPPNIIAISRTNNQQELAAVYSAADVFANPTREEVFGMVNVEALACGTPVITFNTGGCGECIGKNNGIVLNKNDVESLYDAIMSVFKGEMIISQATKDERLYFSLDRMSKEYMDLYTSIVNKDESISDATNA